MSVAKVDDNRKVTTHRLIEMKQRGEKISMLTAYDYSMAKLIDQAGMDVILVGDSASNVMAGNVTTLPITLDQMIYHGKSVMKAVNRALVVVDLPFGTYQGNSKEALASAIRVMKETHADCIKLEGGAEVRESIERILCAGIPIMGHLGLTPQSINKFGTYTVRAREEAEYQKAVRHRSATIISGIAAGAVALSVIFLVMIWRDVTRSNRYRRQLEEANRFAEELLASREKLMLAITHDFKAPLGSIMGYADLLSRLTVDGRQRFYLDNMKTSSEHLLKLVTDLLDFHRLDLHKAEINRVTFHPARLLEEIYVSFEPLTSAKGLSLKCEIDPELKGTFISDPLRLRQIVNNLLSNAVKFTSEGGITLTASFVPKGDSVFSGNHLKLSVIDTGKGMEPGDRERIFQEFTRLPGAQGEEGFGLGLSIVRMLVQLLEGRIEVDSVLGKGSTFTLRVPLYPVALNDTSEVNEQNNANSSSLPAQTPALHILLIDDDRIQLTLTSAMLAQSGITSVSCLQLDELLEALRTDTFDVLLTDVQMPAMNGFDLLNLLRASNIPQAKTIPVIAVTARSDMQREEFLKHGFAGSLHKPFMVNELFAELDIEKRETGLVTPQNHVEMDAVQTDRIATEAVPVSALNFSALTAFSGDDPDAAKSILESFVTETRLNADRLRQALDAEDTDGIAAMGHKMLPLFTLLGADELVALLKELEDSRGQVFSEKIKEKSFSVLALIEDVVAQVEE